MKKLSKKKFIVLASLLFVFAIFNEVIKTWLFFDISEPDIGGIQKGLEMKRMIIASELSTSIVNFNYMFYVSFFAPILILIISYDYNAIKNNLLKFNIGKNNDYRKNLINLKLKMASLSFFVIIISFILSMVISLLFGEQTPVYSEGVFNSGSILNNLFAGEIPFLTFSILTVAIATFVNSIFTFLLIDYKGYIVGALSFLGFIWIGSMILYFILPYYFVPMSAIMITSYGYLTVFKLFAPYTLILLISLFILFTNKYEVS